MKNMPLVIRQFNNKKEEVKSMREVTVFSSEVEEILDGDNRTVSMYVRELDEIVEVTMKQDYMSLDEGIELLIDRLRKLDIKVNYLTDVTLILKEAHKSGSNVSLRFTEEDTKKIHEVNFSNASAISLTDFIENHKERLFSMFRGSLDVDVVKITF